jgi:hypothetical protein
MRQDKEAAKEEDEEIRAGTTCGACYGDLDPPGGTTIWSLIIQNCFGCVPNAKNRSSVGATNQALDFTAITPS